MHRAVLLAHMPDKWETYPNGLNTNGSNYSYNTGTVDGVDDADDFDDKEDDVHAGG